MGCGKVGLIFVKFFFDEGYDVVVIDFDVKNFERFGFDFNGMKI